MIIKIANTNPRVTFLTSQGRRTPKEIWLDEKTGVRDITKKGVKNHVERLNRLGITPNMTEEEAREQARKFLEKIKAQ